MPLYGNQYNMQNVKKIVDWKKSCFLESFDKKVENEQGYIELGYQTKNINLINKPDKFN